MKNIKNIKNMKNIKNINNIKKIFVGQYINNGRSKRI